MTTRRPPTAFVVGVAAVILVMAWVTRATLALERAQAEAEVQADHDEKLRLGLWRMDSWLSSALAFETRRWPGWMDRMMGAKWPKRSPLVATYVRIGDGYVFGDELSALRDYRALWSRIDRGLARVGSVNPRCVGAMVRGRNGAELDRRTLQNAANQLATASDRTDATPFSSILVPMWVRQGDRDLLLFLRHELSGLSAFGFVADADYVKKSLLALVADILPNAKLRALSDDEIEKDRTGLLLASAPMALDAPRPDVAQLPLFTATRGTLGIAWLAVLGSLAAVGIAMKRTADLGERRSRFASSVTHELRTPLTTFRLYSEMLADGMIEDPAKRQEYLETLKAESSRLAALVENVLAYARVEEGRMPAQRERVTVADLLLRHAPRLDRRARDSGMTLTVETAAAVGASIDADVEVVGQVLFNLVDNAAKYAPAGKAIDVTASRAGDRVEIRVRDHGEGIRANLVRAAFTPFERAGRAPGEGATGIGLGLALSRALARDMGGDLDYEDAPGGGACFVLRLPACG